VSLRVSYAAASGALSGALIGVAVCILRDVAWVDAVFRVFVLAASAAWMGMLLAWLNQMLTPVDKESSEEGRSS